MTEIDKRPAKATSFLFAVHHLAAVHGGRDFTYGFSSDPKCERESGELARSYGIHEEGDCWLAYRIGCSTGFLGYVFCHYDAKAGVFTGKIIAAAE